MTTEKLKVIFKRANEVLESSKACVFQQPFFSIKNFPGPQNVHPKRSASKKLLVRKKNYRRGRDNVFPFVPLYACSQQLI